MTVGRAVRAAGQRVSEYVQDLRHKLIRGGVSQQEMDLGVHLRGNAPLHDALKAVIRTRIDGRAALPEPSDPLVAKSMLARDRELQWLLSRLEVIKNSQPPKAEEDGEQPEE